MVARCGRQLRHPSDDHHDALAAALVIAAVYAAAVVLIALRFRRRYVGHDHDANVGGELGVSILVPLEGTEPGLFENLAAYCQLDHRGAVQIGVGSLDPQDAALATARHPIIADPATVGAALRHQLRLRLDDGQAGRWSVATTAGASAARPDDAA
jgi:hypothetical protein